MSHLVFTLDFHELVRGPLQPESQVIISYDPLRIVPDKNAYRHGDPAYLFTAYAVYLPTQQPETVSLSSGAGIIDTPIVELDGRGSMLEGCLRIPAGTTEIACWIKLTDPAGQVFYDSDYGQNYHFRCTTTDIQLDAATVSSGANPSQAVLSFRFSANPAVDELAVRYRIVNKPGEAFQERLQPLVCQSGQGNNTWSSGDIAVPPDAVIAYDIMYYIDGKRFKNDNNGRYFLTAPALS